MTGRSDVVARTDRLVLRRWRVDDASAFAAINADRGDAVRRRSARPRRVWGREIASEAARAVRHLAFET